MSFNKDSKCFLIEKVPLNTEFEHEKEITLLLNDKLYKIGDLRVEYSGARLYKVGGARIEYSGNKLYRINGERVEWSGDKVYRVGNRKL